MAEVNKTSVTSCDIFAFNATSIRRPFDCLSKVIKVTRRRRPLTRYTAITQTCLFRIQYSSPHTGRPTVVTWVVDWWYRAVTLLSNRIVTTGLHKYSHRSCLPYQLSASGIQFSSDSGPGTAEYDGYFSWSLEQYNAYHLGLNVVPYCRCFTEAQLLRGWFSVSIRNFFGSKYERAWILAFPVTARGLQWKGSQGNGSTRYRGNLFRRSATSQMLMRRRRPTSRLLLLL